MTKRQRVDATKRAACDASRAAVAGPRPTLSALSARSQEADIQQTLAACRAVITDPGKLETIEANLRQRLKGLPGLALDEQRAASHAAHQNGTVITY